MAVFTVTAVVNDAVPEAITAAVSVPTGPTVFTSRINASSVFISITALVNGCIASKPTRMAVVNANTNPEAATVVNIPVITATAVTEATTALVIVQAVRRMIIVTAI